MQVRKDGSAVVSEKTVVKGSPFLQRSLPLLYRSGNYQWDLDIEFLAVRDTIGTTLPAQSLVRDHYLTITVPLAPPYDMPKTVVLLYGVKHGIVVVPGTAESYFALTFADDHHWRVPFDEVRD